MRCQDCQAELPASGINSEGMIASCPFCSAVFPFTKEQLLGTEEVRTPKPASLELLDTPERREVSFRWFKLSYVGAALFCVVFNGLLWLLFPLFVRDGGKDVQSFLLPILALAAGFGAIYYTLAGFLNRTRFAIAEEHLVIRHGPLPWVGNYRLPVASVKRVYYDALTSHDTHGRENHIHRLNVALRDGTYFTVSSGIRSRSELQFIAQQLKAWLKLIV